MVIAGNDDDVDLELVGREGESNRVGEVGSLTEIVGVEKRFFNSFPVPGVAIEVGLIGVWLLSCSSGSSSMIGERGGVDVLSGKSKKLVELNESSLRSIPISLDSALEVVNSNDSSDFILIVDLPFGFESTSTEF